MAESDSETLATMQKLLGVVNAQPQKKSGKAKWLTLGVIIVVLAVGVIGSFVGTFDMDKYVLFLGKFSIMFIPLIISIGAGSVAKTVAKKPEEKPEEGITTNSYEGGH